MKALLLLASAFLSFNAFTAYNGPVEVHYESYDEMNLEINHATEFMASITNKACSQLKPGEGIRKAGIEFNLSSTRGFYETVSITPVSTQNIEAKVTIGNHTAIMHSIICYYEKTDSTFDKEKNEFVITKVNSNIRLPYFSKGNEVQWGSDALSLEAAKNKFLSTNAKHFSLSDLPVFKRIDLNLENISAESMMGEYSSLVLTNQVIKIKSAQGGKIINYKDVTRVTPADALIYDVLNNVTVDMSN